MRNLSANIEALIIKAEELTAQEKFKEALEILEELFTNNPNSEIIKNSLIKTLFVYGGYLNDEYTLKYEEAKEKFRRIIEEYDRTVFGSITDITLEDIFIRNGKSDKLIVYNRKNEKVGEEISLQDVG